MQTTGDIPPLGDFADAVFQAPVGFFDRLEKSGGTYILETTAGIKFYYNDNLYIDYIEDLNGNRLNFEYNADNLLWKITDPLGKQFILEYDEMNRIQTLYDKTGNRTIQYNYGDNGDLEEVDFFFEPDLIAGIDYRYLGTGHLFELQHNLVEIISPMGESILENEYGRFPGTWEFNKVVRQRSSDGEYRYEYGPVFDSTVDPSVDPINVPRMFTRVFYPNDHCIEHWFNNQGNVVQRSEQVMIGEAGVPEELIARYRYNEDALLIEETRPDGSATEYHYQREAYTNLHGGDASGATPTDWLAFGNLLKRVERPRGGQGEIRRIVTDYTYYTQGNRLASQKGPYYSDVLLNPLLGQTFNEINFDYDNHGNLIKIHYPDVTLPDGTVQSLDPQVFVYNKQGLVTDIMVGSLNIQLIYFSDQIRSGFIQQKIENADGITRLLQYNVDTLGRTIKIIGYYGATTDIEWTSYDTPKNIISPEVAPGTPRPTVSLQYDTNRQVTQVKEELRLYDGTLHPDGFLIKTYRYDPYGRLIEYGLGSPANLNSRTRKITYTPFNKLEKEVDSLGNVTFTKYNERMLLRSITRGWGTSEQATRQTIYNESAQPTQFIDGLGFKTVIERDGFGRPAIVRDPDDNEREIEYDAVGRIVLSRLYGLHPETGVKVRWSETEFRYDGAGRFIERVNHLFIPGVSGPDTLLNTQYYYDSLNRIETVNDPLGSKLHYTYDGRNRLKSLQDSDGNKTEWHYDDAAHTMTIVDNDIGIDESGNSVIQVFQHIFHFDSRDLPKEEIDNLGNITKRGFDSRSLLNYYEDPNGHKFFTEYDVYGKSIVYKTFLASQQERTQISYNENGYVKAIASPIGGQTVWNYDGLNRIIDIELGGNATSYVYDEEDHVILQKDSNGILLRLHYSQAGLLQNCQPDATNFIPAPGNPLYTPSPTSNSDFKYTPLGNVATAKNDVTSLIFHYDSLGRIIDEQSDGHSVSYRYDIAGHLSGITFPNGRDIGYRHSPSGRLLEVIQNGAGLNYPGDPTMPSSRTLASIWRIRNRPLAMKFNNSHKANFSYDAARRVVAIDWTRLSDGGSILKERDLYGSRGEWVIQQLDSNTRIFSYDDLTRLVNATDYSGINIADISNIGPSVDQAGLLGTNNESNIDSLVTSIKTSASTIGSFARKFIYQLDDNTNRLRTDETLTGLPPTTTQYVPNLEDEYQSVGGKGIVYDRMGNMLSDGTNNYRYDTYNQLSEANTPLRSFQVLRDALLRPVRKHDPSGIEDYVYAGSRLIEWKVNGGIEGQIVPLERPNQYVHLSTSGIDRTPLFDTMDSVIGWLAPDGSIANRTLYDPFGQIINQDPNWPAPFGFAGYWYESDANIYNLKARSYHPRFGRFLQRDPLQYIDGMNQYSYSHHSPGTLTDYWGFVSNDIDWSTAAKEGARTLVHSAPYIIGLGIISAFSAPVAIAAGLSLLIYSGIQSFDKRSDEAFVAGKTQGAAALASMGDAFGASQFIQGISGHDIVTGEKLSSEERGANLGAGTVGLSLTISGGKSLVEIGKSLGETGKSLGGRFYSTFNSRPPISLGLDERGSGSIPINPESGESTATDPVGRKGFPFNQPKNPSYQPVRNSPGTINGRDYTGHAFDRMQDRGFKPSVVENTIQTGIPRAEGSEITYYDPINKIRVSTDAATGRVTDVTYSEGFSGRAYF